MILGRHCSGSFVNRDPFESIKVLCLECLRLWTYGECKWGEQTSYRGVDQGGTEEDRVGGCIVLGGTVGWPPFVRTCPHYPRRHDVGSLLK